MAEKEIEVGPKVFIIDKAQCHCVVDLDADGLQEVVIVERLQRGDSLVPKPANPTAMAVVDSLSVERMNHTAA